MIEDFNIKLTHSDLLILESYKSMLDGLSEYLGSGYEIVLHSLEDCEHAAIKVLNGYHTGRSEGAPITDLALSMLAQIRKSPDTNPNGRTYFTRNRRGEPLKSTTIPIRGHQGRIIGLLCINFYLDTSFSSILQSFTEPSDVSAISESFMENTDDMIEDTVCQLRSEVLVNQAISPENKNKEIVRLLADKGIFNFKGSVQRVADLLGISKNTVYLHLRKLNAEASELSG